MIRATQISFSPSGHHILKPIDIEIKAGEKWVILGANGAGKSTLISLLSGIINSSTGSISYHDTPLGDISRGRLAKLRAVLSQQQADNMGFTVEDIVMMGRYPHFGLSPAADDTRAVDQMIGQMDLEHLRDRQTSTLSGGELQRVHFARCLAQVYTSDSATIFLDEPANHLDIMHQIGMTKQLEPLIARHFSVVAVMHDLNLAYRFATHVLILSRGELLASGRKDEVMSEEILSQGYGTPISAIDHSDTVYWAYG